MVERTGSAALWSVVSAVCLGLAGVFGFVGPDYLAALAGALGLTAGMVAQRQRRADVARLLDQADRAGANK
ncbi:MAG: hypothetical protein JSS20_13925 [Proteobacteria bacterium]|nr:hypothetical protein [Pseudomonadota bacterium]